MKILSQIGCGQGGGGVIKIFWNALLQLSLEKNALKSTKFKRQNKKTSPNKLDRVLTPPPPKNVRIRCIILENG